MDILKLLLSNIDLKTAKIKPYNGFIFLCGGYTDVTKAKPVSIRDAIYKELATDRKIESRIRLAEHYKDWSHDSIYKDLVLFEKHLAELSSLIVLVLESPGSIAELGLFSALEGFQKKLLIFIDTSHYQSSSFIKLGPIDFLEKTHENNAECYRWLKQLGRTSVFDPDAANAIKSELVESIKERLQNNTNEQSFSEQKWLHCALLICDLINLNIALTIREIRNILSILNINKAESEIKQTLYLLERVELLAMEPSGSQRFYISKESDEYLSFPLQDKTLDLHRYRMDVLNNYKTSDKKRFRAIQQVRGRNDNFYRPN